METLSDIIQVIRDPLIDRTKSGIFIPVETQRNEERGVYTGTVATVGPKCKTLKVGDRVVFYRSQYVLYKHEGQEYCGMHEADVIARIES
jgi:co-chaperonin GroES (HSP10)